MIWIQSTETLPLPSRWDLQMETKKTISLGAKGRSRFTEEGSTFDFKITAVGDRLLVADFSADIFMVLGITRQSNHFNVTYNVTFCFIKIMNEILMLLHEHIFKGFNFFFGPIIYCVRLRYENSLPLMVWEVRAMLLSPLSWPVLLSDTKGERRHVLTDLCCLPPTILLVPSLLCAAEGFARV